MTRHLLSLTLLLGLAAPVFAQPGPDDGLPGGPVLPSDSAAPEDEDADEEKKAEEKDLIDVGLAVARYMGRLVSEDPQLTLGAWAHMGSGQGLLLRFRSQRLEAEYARGGRDDARRHSLRYADLINERVIVEVASTGEKVGANHFGQTDVVGGYRFGKLETVFEAKLFRDDQLDLSDNRYRALLRETRGMGEFQRQLRVGLERAELDGLGSTRVVAGKRLSTGDVEIEGLIFKASVDVEIAAGRFDAGKGWSVGMTNRVGLGVADGAGRWDASTSFTGTREELRTNLLETSDDRLSRWRWSTQGSFALDQRGDLRLLAGFDLRRGRSALRQPIGVPAHGDWRASGMLGLRWKGLYTKAELGKQLDGRVRPRVEAGISIPLGRRR